MMENPRHRSRDHYRPMDSEPRVSRHQTRSPSPSPRSRRLERAKEDKDRDHGRRESGWGRGDDRRAGSPPLSRSTERDRARERPYNGSPSPSRRERGSKKRRDEEDEEEGRGYGGGRDVRAREGGEERKGGRRRDPAEDDGGREGRERRPTMDDDQENRSRSGRGRSGHRVEDSQPPPPDSVMAMEEAAAAVEQAAKEKEKPNFEYSGKLAEETNKVRGITLLFTEPPEARKPTMRWRLYVFKDGEPLKEPLYIHRQSAYLFGRERKVADIPTDHPSCSKQHAVIQYRQIEEEDEANFTKVLKVKPYVMDLGSTNGTFINGSRIESQRYYELLEKDTLKFGNSSREYVLLHEHSVG